PNMNIILGENNAGKSNLLRLFQTILEKLTDNNPVSKIDHHDGNDMPMKATLSFGLGEGDILLLMEYLKISSEFKEEIMKLFNNQFVIKLNSSPFSGLLSEVTCG